MYQAEELTRQLQAMGIRRDDLLLVHSSMRAIGPVEGGADRVLDVFMDYLGQEGLLVLPTHTWDRAFDPGFVFDPRTSECCVGILPELFRQRPGVVRSLHPTHSVAAYGRGAAEFVAGEEQVGSPCARRGCWGKLYDQNAKILFLGCPLSKNTFLHGVEEWNQVPDRLTGPHEFQVRFPDGSVRKVLCTRHQNSQYPDISKFYGKMEPVFLALGTAHTGCFGDARCVLGDARAMGDLVSSYLERNPDLFLGDAPVPEDWYL